MSNLPHTPPSIAELLGRSLFPLAALTLLLATIVLGPYVLFALTFLWWRIVTRIG